MVDACQTIPKSDYEQAAQAAFEKPTSGRNDTQGVHLTRCAYFSNTGGKSASASVLIRQSASETAPQAVYQAHEQSLVKALGEGARLMPVAAVGDLAGWSEEAKQLTVFVPRMMLIVTVRPADGGSALEASKLLAAKALERMRRSGR